MVAVQFPGAYSTAMYLLNVRLLIVTPITTRFGLEQPVSASFLKMSMHDANVFDLRSIHHSGNRVNGRASSFYFLRYRLGSQGEKCQFLASAEPRH
jgi:hypothetical protein